MKTIIFSKDRACQLDLLIRSIKDHYRFGTITVLYATSTCDYQKGYDLIKEKYKDVKLVWQIPFKHTLIDTIRSGGRWVTMMVDDSVFINEVSPEEISTMTDQVDRNKLVKGGSLVMGLNVTYSYSHNHAMNVPIKDIGSNVYRWKWTKEDKYTDWGYPHQVGGNVWEKGYLLDVLHKKKFDHPTIMESKLNWPYRKRKRSTPQMVCFGKTKVLTIPVNYIPKSTNENRNSGKYSLEALNELYLDGYRISTENIYNISTNAICKEIDFSFERC